MKPKRAILLIDDQEVKRSVLKLVLETNGYRVCAGGHAEAQGLFLQHRPDLALVRLETYSLDEFSPRRLVEAIKALAPATPVILFSERIKTWWQVEHQADRFLGKSGCATHEILGHMKVLLARKRGPKPGWKLHAMAAHTSHG